MSRRVLHDQLYARLMKRESLLGQDTLNDLDLGTDVPLAVTSTGKRYVRDPRVRARVLARAGGRCELCGQVGFITEAGSSYLECHHIIVLSQDGQDRMTNVIALCAHDHRRAHLARDWRALQREMEAILKRMPNRGIQ